MAIYGTTSDATTSTKGKIQLAGDLAGTAAAPTLKTYQICTSGTRPGSPSEGWIIYETDTDAVYVYSGSDWVQIGPITSGYTTFTPTWKHDTTSVTVGNGSATGRYMRVGRFIHAQAALKWGSTSSLNGGTGTLYIGLPVPHVTQTVSSIMPIGFMHILDFGTAAYPSMAWLSNGRESETRANVLSSGANFTYNTPFTPATGDEWSYDVYYEAAS